MGANEINIVLCILLLLAIIGILFYVSLHKTMNLVSEKNRQMPGSYVWLNLTPLFGIFWPFIFNSSLAKSIENELKDKGSNEKVNLYPGTIVYPISFLFLTNLAYSSYTTVSKTLDYGTLYLSALFLFATFYFWIVFWRQILRFKKILQGRDVVSTPESAYSVLLLLIIVGSFLLGGYLYKEYVIKYRDTSEAGRSSNELFKSNDSD